MSAKIPQEAKNFKLLGHDASAAWGGGSIVEIHKGFAYVGAVGSASFNGPEGFTVHDVRDPRNPKKVAEVKSPAGWFCGDGVTASCEYGASASLVGSAEEVRTTARFFGAFSVVPPFDGPASWVETDIGGRKAKLAAALVPMHDGGLHKPPVSQEPVRR